MSAWDTYSERLEAHGATRRGAALLREQKFLSRKVPNSLSYHEAEIDGEMRECAIINSDNLDTKTICSMPGEELRHGALVYWMGQYWLIIEKDYNTEVYTKAKMQQCNYLLRWVDDENNIIERWCIIEDGTKLTHRCVRWLGMLETVRKKHPLNCWNTLRAA